MISFVTNPASGEVYIHADLEGMAELARLFEALKNGIAAGDCPHTHLFGPAWGGDELAGTMLDQELSADCRQIHHVKIYGWSDEWAKKHGLKGDRTPS